MRHEQNADPLQPDDALELPSRQHDPIEPDPMNPKTVPSLPGTKPQPGELPNEDWDWAEHED